ncbi:MAG: hypothetical protein ACK54K_03330 [Gemmatimonadaceae bacterium]|jgi:predicted acyl esterase|nr:hypothetical protein [Gemmatimonadota bacterium]
MRNALAVLANLMSIGTDATLSGAQPAAPLPHFGAAREAREAKLKPFAKTHRSVMTPLRDGVRLPIDIY